MEDFDAEEEDEEALIEKRRQQRLAIMQVGKMPCLLFKYNIVVLSILLIKTEKPI